MSLCVTGPYKAVIMPPKSVSITETLLVSFSPLDVLCVCMYVCLRILTCTVHVSVGCISVIRVYLDLQKKAIESINTRLALVMKSGKFTLGYRSTLKSLRLGKAKLIILANNAPPLRSAVRRRPLYYSLCPSPVERSLSSGWVGGLYRRNLVL